MSVRELINFLYELSRRRDVGDIQITVDHQDIEEIKFLYVDRPTINIKVKQ